MKKDQVYTFSVARPLSPNARAAIEQELTAQAETIEEPLAFAWDAEDDGQLHIDVGPAKLDVVFYKSVVEVYVDAPLWARVLITKEKEAALVGTVRTILRRAQMSDHPGDEASAASA